MFRLDSNDLGFICAGELSVTNLPPLGIIEKLLNWQFVETYGVFNYGSGWRKDVVNQWLDFGGRAERPEKGVEN